MATYTEIFDLRSNSDMRNKVAVAVVIKSQMLIDGVSPTAAEITWANNTLINPGPVAEQLWFYVLAANNAATVAQILSATDATIQTNVNDAADALIAGGA